MRPQNLLTILSLATCPFLLPACGGSGAGAAAPTVPGPVETDLSISDLRLPPGVTLVGGFDPLAEVYFLRASHLAQRIEIRPIIPGDFFVSSLGTFLPADSGEGLQLPLVEGLNEAEFTITATATLATRVVRFSIERDAPNLLQQVHMLKSSDIKPGDGHGAALDILGDTLVVGSPFEDFVHEGVTLQDAGAVYIYRHEGQGWREFARIQSFAPGAGDQFGASVAMSSNRLIVGAPGEDSEGVLDLADINENAPDCGAAYTYILRDETVEFDRYFKPDAAIPRKTKAFGESVAADGGLFFVGAPSEGTFEHPVLGAITAPNTGAVYVFNANPAALDTIVRLQAPDAAANQRFGTALAVAERRLAVGVPGANGARGKVCVFNPGLTLAGFVVEAEVAAPQADLLDAFGASLDMDGDLLAVGAPLEDSGAEGIGGNQFDDSKVNSGAVYLFRRRPVANGAEYDLENYIKGVGNSGGERFGTAVAFGVDQLCIGAPLQLRAAIGEAHGPLLPARAVGAAFYYVRRGEIWELGATLTAENAHEGAEFGAAVAFGFADLVVGSPKDRTFGQGIDASSVVLVGDGGGAVNDFR